MVRPDTKESVRVVAYVLDRLYHEHTGESTLKVKEIEYRIAELETKFLGENIQHDSDFGCPAVRLQIRSVKRSNIRAAVDQSVLSSFKMVNTKLAEARRREPNAVAAAFEGFWERWDRNGKAYDDWQEETESHLKQELRRALEAATDTDEAFKATDQYLLKMQTHLDLQRRWIDERGEHLDRLSSSDTNVLEYLAMIRYCWHASRRQALLESVWGKYGAFVHQQIIWVKDRPILTRSWYMWQHEPCFFGWLKGKKPRRYAEDYPPSVWSLPTLHPGVPSVHPTEKPTELFAIPMWQHTKPGDICFEPFSGSGTQLVAAEKLGRVCYAMELSPPFVAVALERLTLLGLQPRLCK